MTYYERDLPHWHPQGRAIFLTWRLFGSLPQSLLTRLEHLRRASGAQFLAADRLLDAAKSGPLWLRDSEIAASIEATLLRGVELGHYNLCAYVIMPNHVHLLLEPRMSLARITQALKGVSARHANAALGRVGRPFWQHESFDHWVRNPAQFQRIRLYIENNPVKAGLAKSAEQWRWSSAHAG